MPPLHDERSSLPRLDCASDPRALDYEPARDNYREDYYDSVERQINDFYDEGGRHGLRTQRPAGLYESRRVEGLPHEFDPDYHQWRLAHLRELDDDYRCWRHDRYRKFVEEFAAWRQNRTSD